MVAVEMGPELVEKNQMREYAMLATKPIDKRPLGPPYRDSEG